MNIALQERVVEKQGRMCAGVGEYEAAAGRAPHDLHYIY